VKPAPPMTNIHAKTCAPGSKTTIGCRHTDKRYLAQLSKQNADTLHGYTARMTGAHSTVWTKQKHYLSKRKKRWKF